MGFQFMLILDLLGMYFDAAVVFVTKSSLFFRLAVAILCKGLCEITSIKLDFLATHRCNVSKTKDFSTRT